MSGEIPKIGPIEKVSVLYRNYEDASRITKETETLDKVVPVSDLSNLDGLLTNADSYLSLADSLSQMMHCLRDFEGGIEKNIEYATKYLRGNFNGVSEAETQIKGDFLGVFPYTGSGQTQGKVNGDVNLGVYELENLINTVSSHYGWLKNFLDQYVEEINRSLESVESGEPNNRLKLEIDRVNDAIWDCYQGENAARLKFASQNLLGGLKHIREMMFPISGGYPKKDDIVKDAKDYVGSLRALREFSKGKEKVCFSAHNNINPKVNDFWDRTPKKSILERIFSYHR